MKQLLKIIIYFIFCITVYIIPVQAELSSDGFNNWLLTYKKFALQKGVSQKTLDIAFKNTKFLPQVIKYDRKQPEFYEDTQTYISKRATKSRVDNARRLLRENR